MIASSRVCAGFYMRPDVSQNRGHSEAINTTAFPQNADQAQTPALCASKCKSRPGPKGPAQELIDAVVVMKRRNPTCGCRRFDLQISLAFRVDIDKDAVCRILAARFRPESKLEAFKAQVPWL